MTKRNIACLIGCICASILASCGSLQENKMAGFEQSPFHEEAETADSKIIKNKLYTQFNEWQGVRYRLGGLSRRGIDCSGFVQVTFKSKLALQLPRTTKAQSKIGKEIGKSELRAGDLVFFKTGFIAKHVGIYLEKNKFLHASTRKGVTISKLNSVYWQSNYWKSIRI